MPLPANVRKVAASNAKNNGHREPLWKGPEVDGITYSLLCRFLSCRERFRIKVIEGLGPSDSFNHRLEYGSMWHVCEEAHAKAEPGYAQWGDCLKAYAKLLCSKYPTQQEQVEHWYNVCRVQFPVYVKYWSQHPDVQERTPLLQEVAFSVPYKLPSGRTVRLRGKWDSVDLIGKGKAAGIDLQENKTKGDIDEQALKRQLASGFDLQTMLYLVALEHWIKQAKFDDALRQDWFIPVSKGETGVLIGNKAYKLPPILGVRYNVVRRPLSGGRGSIVRHKATKNQPEEPKEAFFKRLSDIIKGSPQDFFMRWKIEISAADVARFQYECLNPILEQLCDWWRAISDPPPQLRGYTPFSPIHWRHPYGVWNIMDQGGMSELDEYLLSGNKSGLKRATTLFPELE